MADDQQIVIKKVTVINAGAHGGGWKVAFADFMTALMCFFLVMWLLSTTSEEAKKDIAEYFSTPSVIEYNFSNFGFELTLEKLFLDLINEPLTAFRSFITPQDMTPNIWRMGLTKVVVSYMADQLEDVAGNVEVSADEIVFEIPAQYLFEPGTSRLSGQFVSIMQKVQGITTGLEDSNVDITSVLYQQSVFDGRLATARSVAAERLQIVKRTVEKGLEHDTVDVRGKPMAQVKRNVRRGETPEGMLRFKISQKPFPNASNKPRRLEDLFGDPNAGMDVYESFVEQISNRKKPKKQRE